MPLFVRLISSILEGQVRKTVQSNELPALFNDPMVLNYGFMTLGSLMSNPAWNDTTMDMQVDHFTIEDNTLL
jgi:hypothetical protein